MPENANKLNSLWQMLIKHQLTVYFILSTLAFGFQMMRQNAIEQRLAETEKSAIHRTETAFATGISGLLQTATIMETNLIELKQQNLLLIDCVKQKNCEKFPELVILKPQKEYVPVATHYFNIQQQMIERSKEGY